MAHVPARFPRDAVELADWSVYADELLSQGDPLGDAIAYDLALPDQPTREQLAEHGTRRKARCWPRRRAMEAGWCLGHLRTLALWGVGRMMLPRVGRATPPIDDGTLANARDLLRSPIAARLEELHVATRWDIASKPLRRLFAALPESCTTVVSWGQGPDDLDALLALVPRHVTRLALLTRSRTDLGRAIDDRFELVEVPRVEPGEWVGVKAGLAATTRVHIRVGQFGVAPHERCDLGDGAGVIESEPPSAVALARSTLIQLQTRHGLVPIRAQLARRLAERHMLWNQGGRFVTGGDHEATLVQRGDTWTARGAAEGPALWIDDRQLAPGEIVPLRDGAAIRLGHAAGMFVAHDLTRRFAAVAR
jgi:hypothetical protein